jgi:hypothetical protein
MANALTDLIWEVHKEFSAGEVCPWKGEFATNSILKHCDFILNMKNTLFGVGSMLLVYINNIIELFRVTHPFYLNVVKTIEA